MAQETKGLIFLDSDNMIIKESLNAMFGDDARREPIDIRLSDFDDTVYHILVTPEEKNMVQVSVQMKCIKAVLPMGAKAAVETIYGGMLQNSPEKDFDMTFKFDVEKLPQPQAQLVKNLSELRKNILGAPISMMFKALTDGEQTKKQPMMIPYRPKEFIFLNPGSDRVMVYFSMVFDDETDRVIAGVFLQEFVDAQRRVNGAPTVVFFKEPPTEVEKAPGFKAQANTVGYISFQIFKDHVAGKRHEAAVNLMLGFRSYLHYHIKASKAHLHTRMRARVESLLKVLNRANPNADKIEMAAGAKNVQNSAATKAFRKF